MKGHINYASVCSDDIFPRIVDEYMCTAFKKYIFLAEVKCSLRNEALQNKNKHIQKYFAFHHDIGTL